MNWSDGPDSVRALLCALAARGDDLLAPVSTLALQNELNRRGAPIRAADALAQLADLRDVQRLSGGFWLPAPLHLVQSGDAVIAVCGMPSDRLARQYEIEIQILGALRVLREMPSNVDAPSMSMFEWLGIPPDSSRWLNELVNQTTWAAPYGLDDLRMFRSWPSRVRARWIEADEMPANKSGIVLARSALPNDAVQYYFADVHRGSTTRVHEIVPGTDIPRLMCALRCRDQDPTIVRASRIANRPELSVTFEILPEAESRFIRAVASSESLDGAVLRAATIPIQMIAQTNALLSALGASTQGTWQ